MKFLQLHITYYLHNGKKISFLFNIFSLIEGEPIPEVLQYRVNPWREQCKHCIPTVCQKSV